MRRRVVVTGLSSLLLARLGARLALVDEVAERAEAVAGEARALGAEARAVVGDVTEPDQSARAVEDCGRALGGLDLLVNIVGGASWAPLLDVELATWERDQRVHLLHHLHLGRAAARAMIAGGGGGAIVVVGSVSGMFSAAGHGAYGAAKAGLLALVKTMAEEWWPHGIRVNAVVSGMVLTSPGAWKMMEDPKLGGATKAMHLTRLGRPEDLANAILFLASDEAAFITGAVIPVDGGVTARMPVPDISAAKMALD